MRKWNYWTACYNIRRNRKELTKRNQQFNYRNYNYKNKKSMTKTRIVSR